MRAKRHDGVLEVHFDDGVHRLIIFEEMIAVQVKDAAGIWHNMRIPLDEAMRRLWCGCDLDGKHQIDFGPVDSNPREAKIRQLQEKYLEHRRKKDKDA